MSCCVDMMKTEVGIHVARSKNPPEAEDTRVFGSNADNDRATAVFRPCYGPHEVVIPVSDILVGE